MPSLAFLSSAVYLLYRYSRRGDRRSLWLAAALYGVALANRPPVVLLLPFWLVAWALSAKRWEPTRRRTIATLGWTTMIAAAPTAYSFAYFWIRDTPDAAYNYVEQYNDNNDTLPNASAGARAKLERVVWLMTGRQFANSIGASWHETVAKLRWLKNELLPLRPSTLVIGLLIAGTGAVALVRRSVVAAWLVIGVALHSIAYVCVYRIHGQAADILPLLFAIAVCGGVAVSIVIPVEAKGGRRVTACALMLAVSAWVVLGAPQRRGGPGDADAVSFVQTVDASTLPRYAVICAGWREAVPLWYAARVLADRPDLHINAAVPNGWPELFDRYAPRPTFVTRKSSHISGFALTPYRNLWRLHRPGDDGPEAPGAPQTVTD
jgi:hypothetical protein